MPPQAKQITIRDNVTSLMTGKVGKARQKAIITIAKKNNIPKTDARFRQAIKISQRLNRKNNG